MTRTPQDHERYAKLKAKISELTEDNIDVDKSIKNALAVQDENGFGINVTSVEFRKSGKELLVDYTFHPVENGKATTVGRLAKRGRSLNEFKSDLQRCLDLWINEREDKSEPSKRPSLPTSRK
ncbi:hypothetical protein ACEPAG_8329 [Sanghuangporus baumii]